jgi:hypothetical protein
MFDELRGLPKSKDWAKPNQTLDRAVEAVRSKYPHRFLQDHELKERVFMDEPTHPIPMKSFLYSIKYAHRVRGEKKNDD